MTLKYKESSEVKQVYTKLKRNMSDTAFAYKVYTFLVAFTVFGIGFFGTYRLFKQIQTKIALINQLQEINSVMDTNLVEIKSMQNNVLIHTDLISLIPEYMPSEYKLEEYVYQLSSVVSQAGFILRNTTSVPAGSEGDEIITISMRLEGPGDPVDLVRRLERLKRITVVENMTYTLNTHSSVHNDSDVKIDLRIFTLKGLD